MTDSNVKRDLPNSAAETPMSDKSVQQSRRRLIGSASAVIAAPAIFTLPNTAGAKAFGSIASCVRNTGKRPSKYHVGSRDRWARSKVYGIYLEPDVPGTGPDEVIVKYGRGHYVCGRNRRWSKGYRPGTFVSPDGVMYRKVARRKDRYTVAWVDHRGRMLGNDYRWGKHGGKAISGSCWVSILGKA